MSIPEVIVIGDFPFPYGSAGANILRGHCVALQAAGYTVGMLPKSQDPGGTGILETTFRGVRVWRIPQLQPRWKFLRVIQENLKLNDARIQWLKQADLRRVKAVIAYTGVGAASAFFYHLNSLCKKRGVRLFCIVAEWHAWRHFSGKQACLDVLDSEFLRRAAVRWGDGTITISDFLQDYYTRAGLNSICLPPLLDLTDPYWQGGSNTLCIAKHRPIKLLFSGSFRRERHDVILRAVLKMRQEGVDIIMEYLGPSRDQIQREPKVGSRLVHALGAGVCFYGPVHDPETVARITRSASFGVLLRDNLRWAQACFPSKVPEFLAMGIPLMANLSSDLADYLRDGENALVCRTVTVNGLYATLRRAWELTEPQFQAMKLAALKTAERFDARNYAKVYQQLIG